MDYRPVNSDCSTVRRFVFLLKALATQIWALDLYFNTKLNFCKNRTRLAGIQLTDFGEFKNSRA